jgi:hypothetical protein
VIAPRSGRGIHSLRRKGGAFVPKDQPGPSCTPLGCRITLTVQIELRAVAGRMRACESGDDHTAVKWLSGGVEESGIGGQRGCVPVLQASRLSILCRRACTGDVLSEKPPSLQEDGFNFVRNGSSRTPSWVSPQGGVCSNSVVRLPPVSTLADPKSAGQPFT